MTNLEFSDFTDAVAISVDFTADDLYGANITADQLATAASICNAIPPNGYSIGKYS